MANYFRGKPDRRTQSRGRSHSIRMSKAPWSRGSGLESKPEGFSNEGANAVVCTETFDNRYSVTNNSADATPNQSMKPTQHFVKVQNVAALFSKCWVAYLFLVRHRTLEP